MSICVVCGKTLGPYDNRIESGEKVACSEHATTGYFNLTDEYRVKEGPFAGWVYLSDG